MKNTFYILLIVSIYGCSINNRITLRLDKKVGFEHFTDCQIYRINTKDSIPKIVKSIDLDLNGNIIGENYTGYETNVDGKYVYEFSDNKKVKKTFYSDDNVVDNSIMLYSYDSNGNLTRHQSFKFSKVLKKGIGGCIISENDYKKRRKWILSSEMIYNYNNKGLLIEKHAESDHWDRQNRFTFKYDLNNKLSEKSSYDHDRLIWIETYQNYLDSTIMVRTWYDDNGQIKDKNKPTYIIKYDKNGNEIENILKNKNGELISIQRFIYSDDGKLLEHLKFDKNNNWICTYKYRYNNGT